MARTMNIKVCHGDAAGAATSLRKLSEVVLKANLGQGLKDPCF